MVKVILIHNIIAPYRHFLFEKLSKFIDIHVYYCRISESFRKWDIWPRKYNYRYTVLPGITLKIGEIEVSCNPTIIREIIRNQPNLVILCGYSDLTNIFAFILCKFLKIPMILWIESYSEQKSLLSLLFRPIRKYILENVQGIIVPGILTFKFIQSYNISAKKIFRIFNAIDDEIILNIYNKFASKRDYLRKMMGLENYIVILSVGQLIERKGYIYLVKAFNQLQKEFKNLYLIICGDGPLKSHLIKYAIDNNLTNFSIIRPGLSTEELFKLYILSDIFVLPSIEDIWGFVVIEAMLCGLPVVATRRVQSIVEICTHQIDGIIIREKSISDLYNSIKLLIENDQMRKLLGKNGQLKIIKKYNSNKMVLLFLITIFSVLLNVTRNKHGLCHSNERK